LGEKCRSKRLNLAFALLKLVSKRGSIGIRHGTTSSYGGDVREAKRDARSFGLMISPDVTKLKR
jgi:hypothetical protein